MAKKDFGALDNFLGRKENSKKKNGLSGIKKTELENSESWEPAKPSMINSSSFVEELKRKEEEKSTPGPKSKNKKPQFKRNANLPFQVMQAFLMYCLKENKFQKDVFPEMLEYLLIKYRDSPLEIQEEINGVPVDLESTGAIITLEFSDETGKEPVGQWTRVRLLKTKNAQLRIKCGVTELKLKYRDIYAQAIIQYLHEKQFNLSL